MKLEDSFLEELQRFVGEKCWAVVGGNGSIITLDFGQMIPRIKPLSNPRLDPLVREFESSVGLFLLCPWRIESDKKIFSASHMSNEDGGKMEQGFSFIRDKKVIEVICTLPAYDLQVCFEDGIRLVIHCSCIEEEDEDSECYSYSTEQGTYIVKYDGRLEYENKEE